jgi:hypothetical protein
MFFIVWVLYLDGSADGNGGQKSGVVKEGLRLSDGVSSRLPRIVPASGMFYKDTFIPPGVIVLIFGIDRYLLTGKQDPCFYVQSFDAQ